MERFGPFTNQRPTQGDEGGDIEVMVSVEGNDNVWSVQLQVYE